MLSALVCVLWQNTVSTGAGEMALWFRTLDVLLEDPEPSTHVEAHSHQTSVLRDQKPSSGILGYQRDRVQRHIYKQNTHTNN